MKLQRIKVEQLRQFRQPFELTGLEPGLNLFAGPNEAGKSTLVRAIRAAFFERHRSTSVIDLLPWGDASATPTIELDFEADGQLFKLRKCFLTKKRCELVAGARKFDGEDAERHLAQLLGFEFSGSGASKPKHWGIPGLLWIEQGAGQEIGESVSNATDHLRKALEQSVGEVASSQGDDVIERVREQRNALLTANGRARAGYLDAIEEEKASTAQLFELDVRIAQYREQVDQLGSLTLEDAVDRQAKPWEALRIRQTEAESAMAAIAQIKGQLDADRAALLQAQEKQKLVEDQLDGFDTQQRTLTAREAAVIQAQALVQTRTQSAAARSATVRVADASYRAASAALALSRQEHQRADLARQVKDAAVRVARITKGVAKAEAEQLRLSELLQLVRSTALIKKDVALLGAQQSRLDELRIRQQVAATRLQFDLVPGTGVTLAGQLLSGCGEQLITQDTLLHVEGVGDFRIAPGGTDLAELAREETALLLAHRALLQGIGVASSVDAQARQTQHQQAVLEATHVEKTLASLAPEGIDALRAELLDDAARQAAAQDAQAQLPPAPESLSDSPPEALEPALAREQAASDHLTAVSRQDADGALALAMAQSQQDSALRERDALLSLLQAPQQQARQRDVNQALLNVRAESAALQLRVAARQSEVDGARSDILAQDVERFKRSADQSERQFRERHTAITVLQGRLEEAGAQGLEEMRFDAGVRCDAALRRLKELKLRAEAFDLLLNLLDAKRQALTRRLQAPLQKHVQHYLQLLFPQATLDIGPDLIPGNLTRAGHAGGAESGHYSSMSFGAREQMGVISRLAYADLLKEAGRPTLIILDDALVHSDTGRLEQMKRVLFDASQRHQVLLFTCHPARWQDLGVRARPIGSALAL
jgi:energy-coupling factor transporter ATP-binding protein EcfA2